MTEGTWYHFEMRGTVTGAGTVVDFVYREGAGSEVVMASNVAVSSLSTALDNVYNLDGRHNTALVAAVDDAFFSEGTDLSADFNDDGVIDDLDLTILATSWDQCGKDHSQGDANGDGCVDDLDLTALATGWPSGSLGASVVPEPATLSLLAMLALSLPKRGGLALIRRRRR